MGVATRRGCAACNANTVLDFALGDAPMNIASTVRYAAVLSAAVGLLAGCGGPPSSLALPARGTAQAPAASSSSYSILYKFGGSPDGAYPDAALLDVRGTLYGTTSGGGTNGAGTVFAITKSGEETVLHSFGGPEDGASPAAGLIDVDGTLYGTTTQGGTNQCGGFTCGTVFSITPHGKEKVLYSFGQGASDGALPYAGLLSVNGTLYGTTLQGGAHPCHGFYGFTCGTVFSITTDGTERVVYSFGKNGADGEYPRAALTDVGGRLYGTTSAGGKYGRGTVFALGTAGREQVLYHFGTTGYHDGTTPLSGLVNAGGTLYGTTEQGGQGSGGTVFSITKFGKFHTVLSFTGGDGSWPMAGLIDVKGVLYSTTSQGGTQNIGTIYSLTKTGDETVLHSFEKDFGQSPATALVDAGGTLYGTTPGVYGHSFGSVFAFTP